MSIFSVEMIGHVAREPASSGSGADFLLDIEPDTERIQVRNDGNHRSLGSRRVSAG